MYLPQQTIKEFLTKPRDDMRGFKKMTPRQMEALVDQLPMRPPLWDKLRHHQKVGVLLGIKHRGFAFWYDTGTGKTLISISLARYFIETKQATRFLVLTAANINRGEWEDEIRKHSPSTSCTILEGSTKDKWRQFEDSEAALIVATYAGVTRMCCHKVRGPKNKNMLKLDLNLVARMGNRIDGLILDESIFIGNHQALIFRICRQLVKQCVAVFNLCGTPFGRDPTPLWAQMFLIDGGESLGPNLGIFRAALFKAEENRWSGFPEYKFIAKNKPILNRMIAHRSLRYEADQADLPAVVKITKHVHLAQSTSAYYEEAKETLRKANGNEFLIKGAFLRMRQIASGFLGFKDDELGLKSQIEFEPNNKLELLISLVQSIYLEHKVLVLHDFVTSGRMICRELERLKIPHARAFGQQKDVGAEKTRFQTDPECNVFVLNTSGAFGLNLQAAKYGIFFESPVSPILRKQMERRWCRQESPHKTVYRYDLIVQHSVEEKIRNFHRTGNDLLKAIIDREVLL